MPSSDAELDAAFGNDTGTDYASRSDAELDAAFGKTAAKSEKPKSILDRGQDFLYKGAEALGAIGSGIYANLSGDVGQLITGDPAVKRGIANDYTFRPRTEGGQKVTDAAGKVLEVPGQAINALEDEWGYGPNSLAVAPRAQALVSIGNQVAPVIGGKFLKGGVSEAIDPQAAMDAATAGQSMGAAGTAIKMADLSPPLRQSVMDTVRTNGGAVNIEALAKHAKADEFGVQLTKGQAMGETPAGNAQRADEFNTRNKNADFAARGVYNNQKLIDGINGIKEDVASGAAVDDETNAQTVIDAYKRIYKPIAQDATAKWQKFQDAAGGSLPLDPGDLTKTVSAALKKVGKTNYLPSEVASDLRDIDDGEPFTVERWDNLKTNLASAERKAQASADGNAGLAIRAARDAVENYNFKDLDPNLKALNDDARAATARKYALLRSDPAMDEAVNDGVPEGDLSPAAKGYMDRNFLKAPKANLAQSAKNLEADADAKSAIAGTAVNRLKKNAGIDMYRDDGDFSQAGYNKTLNELQPRIQYLMDADSADKAFRLGDVARNVKRQGSSGAAFNNSGTSVASHVAQRVGSGLLGAAETGANIASGPLKLGTATREEFGKWADQKWVRESLKPGAGIGDLTTKP